MNTAEFIEKCRTDFPFFCQYMCGKILSPKQAAFGLSCSKNPHTAAIFSRQSGKSTVVALWTIWSSIYDTKKYKTDDGKLHIHVYAPIEEQSFIIFNKIKLFTRNNPAINAFVDTKETQWKGGMVAYRNGNTIQARSASEHAHIRGHSPVIIVIDESQDITEHTYWRDILPSGATTGAKIVESGTPKGRNHFYRHTLPESDTSVIYQLHTEFPYMDLAYVARMKAHMPKADFDQEFNCVFQTDIGMAFDYKLLTKRVIQKGLVAERYIASSQYYAGLDLGKHDDATVLSIFRLVPTKDGAISFRQAAIYDWVHEDWDYVIREIGALVGEWHLKGRVMTDRLNVGDVVVDLLKDYDLRPVVPTIDLKQDAVDRITKMMEDGKLILLPHGSQARQMINYERRKTPSGKYRFAHPDGEHDDFVTANIMAALAMYEELDAGDITYVAGESLAVASGLSAKQGDLETSNIPLSDNNPRNLF